ncbi:PiggyBac transposable element-derived protein 4-like [Plakobranchus ocellatus]|uniref:PiggyBac transposable element-derived protein 4-like n=1 Tax=Plakobranchus ocellatus TaxID=259542 RepID=A0AAV4E0L5_9GAST|nr:PiggyBac transposable element-derived protein 4-like [Plakobranchus ocellatus]
MRMAEKVVIMREEESDEDDTDLFEDVPFRLGENLNVGREAAQSESSFNSNPVRPAPDVDENVNLDLSVRSESESEDENMAVYDADTEVDDGPDVDLVVELDQDQQNYDSGEWQNNTEVFPKLPKFSAQPGIKVALSDDPSPLEVYKLFITDELINSWKADNIPLPMDRLKRRHFLSVCPNTEASDSRGKKAQRHCKVCADRAKVAGQTPAERKNKRKLTTTWCRECKVGLCLDCFEIYHTKRDYINN